MALTFARPAALWLLLALIVFAALGYWLGARSGRIPRSVVVLRLLIVGFLVVGLAEPMLATGADAASTIFVVDRSTSLTDTTAAAAADWVTRALEAAGDGDRVAVVTFGTSPILAAPADRATAIGDDWANPGAAQPDPDFTNVESALALARALPLGGSRRIVLVSDGAENVGGALNQASLAASDGVPIDVVPLEGVGGRDLRVEGATAPTSTWVGQPVTVLASVDVGVGGPARLELWVDGVLKTTEQVDLPAGLSSHEFELTDLPAGFHAVEVKVAGAVDSDRYVANNSLPMAIVVRDQPRLMLIAPSDSDPRNLSRALEQGGALVEVVDPSQVPSRLSVLGEYDGFVLDNVPASALSFDQVAGLQEATRSLGRGMIVIGGTSSYGPGAYAGTLLERALPVTVKVSDGRQRQRIALLLIMDKSGSMSYDPLGGAGKIEMAKEAVAVAAHSLTEGDQIGLLVFNDKQEWVIPITELTGDEAQWEEIDRKIAAIGADGGTEILPALSVGLDAIRNIDADARHIVLLSDGKSRTGTRESYQKLLDDMLMDRTTLSTIAIGEDADTDLLNFLADEGGGRYHFTERPEEIPQLTLEEARSAGNQSVVRGSFQPVQKMPSPILADFPPAQLPPLDGYDFAEAKPDAQVVLVSNREDPVLAKWQYGLGRVIAWTSDSGADLAADWPAWQRYDEFWAAMLHWVLPDPEHRPIQVSISQEGPEAVISVDAIGEGGDFVDLATTTATITTPGGDVVENLALAQTGPGQYQIRVAAPDPGAYKIELVQERAEGPLTELAGFSVPPSPELQPAPGAAILLQALAARTGGRVLSLDDPSSVFSSELPGTPLRQYRPLWYLPLALALALLVVEIAIRMRVFHSFDLRRLFAPRL